MAHHCIFFATAVYHFVNMRAYWDADTHFVNIFIGLCSKVYLFMAVLCIQIFSIRKWAFNKRKPMGCFDPVWSLFTIFPTVSEKKSSYNEHAYFASVFQVCDVRHVWRKLSPQPARLDPNQKRNNLDISHLRRVGAGIFMFLPFAGKRVMPNVQINIAHRVGVMVIKSITIFILLSA